jgi:hypothetical protein
MIGLRHGVSRTIFHCLLMVVPALPPGAATAADTRPAEADKKPGFWKRLTTEGIRIGPAASSPSESSRPVSPNVVFAGDSKEPMHASLAGANRLPGIFASDNESQASKGLLEWPRVAVTWKEFGEREPCWLGEARIWTNATESKTETFRICTAPIEQRDDLGQVGWLRWQAVSALSTRLNNTELHFAENSGSRRTAGPLPPLKPFGVKFAIKMQPGGLHAAENLMPTRYGSIIVRLAIVTGFLRPEGMGDTVEMELGRSGDKRLWIAGFDAAGNLDAGK